MPRPRKYPQELIERGVRLALESGRPVAHVAAEMGISRPTAYKWWQRWREGGVDNLVDRSSRPWSCPHQTAPKMAAQIEELRCTLKLGPARIGARLGVPASTVHRVLVRLGLNGLAWMDRPTGRVIRRYERDRPGELVHVDVKKLGRIPPGGGWRVLGRDVAVDHHHNLVGYAYVHSAVDDHSRLAYSEVLDDERKDTCAQFWERAASFFADHNINVTGVMTDNAKAYWSHKFQHTIVDTGARHWSIPPRNPRSMARSSASIEHCWRNGPMSVPTPQRLNGSPRWTPGCISTTITGATPPSAVHPSPASTTYRVTTSRRKSQERARRAPSTSNSVPVM